MRNIVLGFLTLIMLTPSLACAMSDCAVMAQAENQPCHKTSDNTDDGNELMLLLDCMSVDLHQQSAGSNIQPDQSAKSIDYAWADLAIAYRFQPDNIYAIRGPPAWAEKQPKTTASIILTTQRFLI